MSASSINELPSNSITGRSASALYYEVLRYQPDNLELLNAYFTVTSLPDPTHDTDQVLAEIDVVFAPLGYFWGPERIDRARRLKIIASNTTGVPHIDVAYAAQRGIHVISLQDQTAFLRSITATAELTWGLILSVVRRIPWAFDAVQRGVWDRRQFGGPAMLSSMSLGVVGMGRLGTMVAQRGHAFGMHVRYFDPVSPGASAAWAERMPSLEALVAASDIITIHIPLNAGTQGLFSAKLFAQCKPGAYLMNTSRGEVVDSQALLAALESGHLAGAGLDVLAGEFEQGFAAAMRQQPLLTYARQHQNLLITPHIGGSTIDAWRVTERRTIDLVVERLK